MNCRYTCIDSFCGAGGLALGLRRAGLEVLVSFDASKCAVETFRRNLSGRCLHAEAASNRCKAVQGGRVRRPLDLFAGGPPCQGFSKQKRGAHLGDEGIRLVLEFARLVRETDPDSSSWKTSINPERNAARTSWAALRRSCGVTIFTHTFTIAQTTAWLRPEQLRFVFSLE